MEEEYFAFVAEVAAGPTPSRVILNRSAAHAAIILERLFLTATGRVRILSRGLSEDVYGTRRVIDAAILFLSANPEACLELLVERADKLPDNAFVRALVEAGYGDRIRQAVVPAATAAGYRFNFAVADGESYRFEDDRDTRHATVQFGSTEFGSSLDRVFDLIAAPSGLAPHTPELVAA